MKNDSLTSPGCGYCIMEDNCPKRKIILERKMNETISKEDAFIESHTCKKVH